jgi:predicted SnoaL-like aldol condensation-catalyzing enzyme
MSNKTTAEKFLKLVTNGKIREAYAQCVSPDFRHHNAYYKGDAASLMKGMEENDRQFPHKVYELQHAVEEGNMVVTHGRVQLAPDQQPIAVVHIFRFNPKGLIAELWDIGQQVPKDSPNENGMF